MEELGRKIRIERRKNGLTLEQLARKVGISPITLQRIETGKTSPSVALLSEIAQNLKKTISSFVQEFDRHFVHIKRKEQRSISSPVLNVKVIGPRKMITDHISVTLAELKKGKTITAHSNEGIEWAYIMEGKCRHQQGDETFLLEAGDSVSYNARVSHSVTALEKLKFFAIYVREGE